MNETTRGGSASGLGIPWDDLVAVGIRTTADGPFAEDVFWQFLLPSGLVELSGSRFGGLELDVLAKRLEGFDVRKVISAMGSCDERIFRVWHRDESRGRPDEASLRTRFAQLVRRLGATKPSDETFARLYSAWSSDARRYHDVEHLTDCLRELGGMPESEQRDRVELALFYHDAIYEPGAADCETRSASWLENDAAALGVHAAIARDAARLVRATAHVAHDASSEDEALIADIDLAILGRDPIRFLEFEYAVEEEFRAVPTIAFRVGRGRFLASLLASPLYRTPAFRERLEDRARANVRVLLEGPRYRAYRWLRWLS